MPELYREMECELYEFIHGDHFTAWTYDWAVSGLSNADGTKGPHWKVDEIVNYAHTKGAKMSDYNEYDLAYAMNMVYSDYYGAIPDTTDSYYKVAVAFLDDKDAPKGKAYLYYKAMKGE